MKRRIKIIEDRSSSDMTESVETFMNENLKDITNIAITFSKSRSYYQCYLIWEEKEK